MKIEPQYPIPYVGRGNARRNKGDLDGAIADYSEAIRLDPKYASAYNNRGWTRRLKSDLDGAIADFDQAIRLDPKGAVGYYNRGLARKDKGNINGAIADYTAAINIEQRYTVAYLNRGIARQSKNDLDGALADYEQAIRLEPKDALAFNSRGMVRQIKGDVENAIADYDQAIKLDPAYTAAYTNRGLAFEKKKDAEHARADFTAALDVPEKYSDGQWAHDTARQHLAANSLSPGTVPPVARPPPVSVPPTSLPSVADVEPSGGVEPAGARVALVIGNSNYATFPKIPNPRNDAEDIGQELKSLGFEVLLGTDLKRADMEDIFIRFARKAREADTALVYYAGHGLQYQGVNYLAPVDSHLEDETDLRKLVSLQNVISDLQNAGHVRILIVDACRDNEVMKQLAGRLPATRSAAFAQGLARVSNAEGTLIAFATQPDKVAADGQGRHSPFAQSLLKNLPTPGLELRTLMTRCAARW